MRGLIDLERIDPRGPNARDRLELTLRELRREEASRLAELELMHSLAWLVATAASDPADRTIIVEAGDRAAKALDLRRRLGSPWLKPATAPAEDASLQAGLRAMWVREFGDPSDPGVAAGIAATARALMAQCVAPGQSLSPTG